MSIPTLAFPQYAPLPTSFILTLLDLEEAEFLRKSQKGYKKFVAMLTDFEMRFLEERTRISTSMRKLTEAGPLTMNNLLIQAIQVTNGRLPDEIDEGQFLSESAQISRQTLSRWRKKNWLLDQDRIAAILIAFALQEPDQVRRNFPALDPVEPSYYCYQLESPTASWLPCPVPVPKNLPPSTLLWTPYRTFDSTWIVTEMGSMRWAHTDQKGFWDIPAKELMLWNKTLASPNARLLDLAGIGIAARHNIANATLLLFSMQAYKDRPFSFPITPRSRGD